jgi:hypothetical protein
MAGLDQRSSLGTGFDHPRMPQPFIETLALQHTQRVTPIAKPRRDRVFRKVGTGFAIRIPASY